MLQGRGVERAEQTAGLVARAYARFVAKRETSKSKAKRSPIGPAEPLPARILPVPVPLGSIIGQDRALKTLRDAASSGRVHHAWIFRGPAGVGKFTTAVAFAAWVLDPASLEGKDPKPDSEAQHLLAAGVHPGFHVITKETTAFSSETQVRDQKQRAIPIDVVREFVLRPAAMHAPMPGGIASKVFVVDDADLLNVHSQNALLKTLEEPSAGTLVILVTPRDEVLLPTIRSRCQVVTFGRVSDEGMRVFARSRGLELGATDVRSAARFQAGSPGMLELAVRSGLVSWPALVDPMLDSIDRGDMPALFGANLADLMNKWAEASIEKKENASKQAATQRAGTLLFALIASYYDNLMRECATANDLGGAARAAACLGHVRIAEEQFGSNVHPMFVLDNLAAQCAVGAPAVA